MADSKVIFKILGDNSEYQKSLDDTEKKSKGLFSKLSSAAGTAMKAIGVATLAAGAAAIKLGKDVAEAYGELEQLRGGAELMFGEAYSIVAKNASEAYKTVQMSQNEYLQQVNGFATGLKEALGGNEEAAATLAHNIIQAEADIVAATGKSQEEVQNAFNGIMKGNYMMLDNLGLGIKASKEGMQEVIDKVNDWHKDLGDGVRYSIDNVADVEQALVDYVAKVKIAGYASKEASGTIQGSLAMLSGSWKDLIAGLGDPEADLDSLVAHVLESIDAVIANFTPLAMRIVEALPVVVQGLLDGISANAGPILDALSQVIVMIVDMIISNADKILLTVADIIIAVAKSLAENADKIAEVLPAIIDAVLAALIELTPLLVEAGIKLFIALVKNLPYIITQIVAAIPQILSGIVEGFMEAIPGLRDVGEKLFTSIKDKAEKIKTSIKDFCSNLVDGIKERFHKAKETMAKVGEELFLAIKDPKTAIEQKLVPFVLGIVNKILDTFFPNRQKFIDMGKKLFEGLIEGIKAKVQAAVDAVKNAVKKVIDGAKSLLGIHSPSTVFAEIGEETDEGLAVGLTRGTQRPVSAVQRVVGQVAEAGLGLTALSPVMAMGGTSYNSSFNVSKLADNLSVRSDADIDAISDALYRRFTLEQRGRGQH